MSDLSRKDILAALAWVFGTTCLFVGIVWVTTALTATSFKDASSTVQAIGTIVAISVGGAFAFYRLQVFRSFEPHLTISHTVSHRPVGSKYVHIAVTASLRNSSKVKLDLREGFFLLQQVAPVEDDEVERLYAEVFVDRGDRALQWQTLDKVPLTWEKNELIVEPSESHVESCEFIVSADVESVVIYSYFYNPRHHIRTRTSEGWAATTIYDIVDIE